MQKKLMICGIIMVLLGSSIVTSTSNYNEKTSILNNENFCNYKFPIMRPNSETLYRWIESYNDAPIVNIDFESKEQKTSFGGTIVHLLSHLEYNPEERYQGECNNCWAWVGTGCLEIALDVQENIKDRLSIQYINSCQYDVIGISPCEGGNVVNFTDMY